MVQKTLLSLNIEELTHVVVMAMTDDNPSHYVKHADATVMSNKKSISFDDVVFIALVHSKLTEAVGEALQSLRTRTSTFYNCVPWPMPNSKHPFFDLVTSISGIFTSESRLRFALQALMTDAEDPKAETKLWRALYTFPCCMSSNGSNSRLSAKAVVNFAKICGRCNFKTQQLREKTAGYRMSNMAIVGMLKVAPLAIVTRLFPEIFSPKTEDADLDLGLDLEFPHHRLVVSSAAYWGRIDVLEELFHTNSAAACNYDRKRGLLQYMFPNIGGGVLAALSDAHLQPDLVEAAVAANRVDVLNWLTKTFHHLQIRLQQPKRLPTFLRLAHPHFFDVAWIAARRGSTDVLDLLYRQAKCNTETMESSNEEIIEMTRELPQHTCFCKLTVLIGLYILAFGGGSNHTAHDVPCIGASQRWAQAQWQKDAWFMFELLCVATSHPITQIDEPSTQRLFGFFGFVTLLYSPALVQAQMQAFTTRRVTTFAEWLIINCHTKQAIEEVVLFAPGDKNSAEWVCTEIKPGGFLFSDGSKMWSINPEDDSYPPHIFFLQKKLDHTIKARTLFSFHCEHYCEQKQYRGDSEDAVSRFEHPYAHAKAPCMPCPAATVRRAKTSGYTTWMAEYSTHYMTYASQYLAKVQPTTTSFGTLAGKLFQRSRSAEGLANYAKITSTDCGIASLLSEVVMLCFDDNLAKVPLHHSAKSKMVKEMFYAECVDPFGSTYFDKSHGRFSIPGIADAPVWNAIKHLKKKSWTRTEDNEWLIPLEAAFCNSLRRS